MILLKKKLKTLNEIESFVKAEFGAKTMDNAKIDTNYLSFVKAKKSNINIMLDIIRRCVLEINAADYTQNQVKDLLNSFTED